MKPALALVVTFVIGIAPSIAAAQSDWGRAEDEAIGDHTEDATQSENPLPTDPEAGTGTGTGTGTETETETDSETETETDSETETETDSETDSETETGSDDTGLFGSTDEGGAIVFFGDIGSFFGNTAVLGGVGAIGQAQNAFSLTPWFGISYGITDKLILGAEWGFSLLAHDGINTTSMGTEGAGVAVVAGNPTIFARWLPAGAEGEFRWGIDFSIGFPVANGSGLGGRVAVDSAIGSRGAWDLFHWLDGAFSFVPGMFVELEPVEGFVLRGEVDLALIFGVGNARFDGTVGVLQLGADASYRLADPFAIGLRITGVLMGESASPTRDTFQLAMAPYLAFFAGPLFLRGEFLLNITEPYGTSFSNEKWWGARLVVGVDLD